MGDIRGNLKVVKSMLILVLPIYSDVCQHCIFSTFLSSVKKITGILVGWDQNPGPLQFQSSVLPTRHCPPRLPGSQRQFKSYILAPCTALDVKFASGIKNNHFSFTQTHRCGLVALSAYSYHSVGIKTRCLCNLEQMSYQLHHQDCLVA